jgi:hypothetical protein
VNRKMKYLAGMAGAWLLMAAAGAQWAAARRQATRLAPIFRLGIWR